MASLNAVTDLSFIGRDLKSFDMRALHDGEEALARADTPPTRDSTPVSSLLARRGKGQLAKKVSLNGNGGILEHIEKAVTMKRMSSVPSIMDEPGRFAGEIALPAKTTG
mmetsp:Transcript_80851/g.142610  ORF Transcript_80851/g.142610 Transcript_80851/m.142610 type:complete len:109 (+) Transcript_80851:16-342(+)